MDAIKDGKLSLGPATDTITKALVIFVPVKSVLPHNGTDFTASNKGSRQ